jgi:hypothetical protein
MRVKEEKYDRIMDILRRSKPSLADTADIENNVMRRIREITKDKVGSANILDYLFGWVYIGWVRRGLIAASFLIIGLFVFQQTLIIKHVSLLERQAILSESQFNPAASSDLQEKMLLYKITSEKSLENITISERQLNRLLRSYDDLETKYRDLLKLIEDDPVLKQYINEKISGENKRKYNL